MTNDVEVKLSGVAGRGEAGDLGPAVAVALSGVAAQGQTGRLGWEAISVTWKRRPVLLAAVTGLTVGSPFLGLYLAGWIGVAVGLALGGLAFGLGFLAVTKVVTERSRLP